MRLHSFPYWSRFSQECQLPSYCKTITKLFKYLPSQKAVTGKTKQLLCLTNATLSFWWRWTNRQNIFAPSISPIFFCFDVFRDHEVQGGVLTIPSLSREDVGEYICTAQNRFGSAQATVLLDIGGTKGWLTMVDNFLMTKAGKMYFVLPKSAII